MYTQVTCPNCGTPYQAEVHQVVDSKHTPELKQLLLNGSLNMAVCPSCGAGGQLSSILLFHDAEYEMFMIYVPQELNLNEMQREQSIGRLTREVMDSLPQEERRAYMLQPQIMLNMQTFMENVLETEGITKEMIHHQQQQAELLNTLITADKDVQDYLLQERSGEIDETFFAMLQSYIDTAAQMPDDSQLLPLTNLRAKLMMETAVGRQLEKRQIAVHKMTQAAKKQGGLTSELLVEHVVANQEDEATVDTLVMNGQAALQYQFFSELTNEIEKEEKAGNLVVAQRLTDYRTKYLEIYDQMQEASQQMMAGALETITTLIEAPDKETAVHENIENLDDAFMYVLSARMAEAEAKGNEAEFLALNEIQALIVGLVEQQLPPQIQLINSLVRAEDEAETERLLNESAELLSPELVEIMDQVIDQAAEQENRDLDERLQTVRTAVQARILLGSDR